MKIIDNKKDYYDYLAGVYGIDDKVVFDRRGSVPSDDIIKKFPAFFSENEYDSFGNPVVSYGYGKNKECKLNIIVEAGFKKWFIRVTRVHDTNTGKTTISYSSYDPTKSIKPSYAVGKWWERQNEEELKKLKKRQSNSIVSIRFNFNGYYPKGSKADYVVENPLLGGFPFKGLIPSESVWDACYDYIMATSTPNITDNRTDIEHLESAGFDKKTSFRKM